MLAEEWPVLKAAYEQWLAPDNFDERGRQKTRLSELTWAALSRYRGNSRGTGTGMCGAALKNQRKRYLKGPVVDDK